MMKAMILAAGRGTRLGPATDRIPKPMMPVAGSPLLEHIVTQIRDAGITELFMNLHHQPDSIRTHFSDGKKFGVHITYSVEKELLGTAGAVKKLESHFTESFLVYYGDNYVEIDLKDFIQHHSRFRAAATIAVFPTDTPHLSGIAQVDDKLNVRHFIEKPPAGSNASNLANAGIYALEPELFAAIPPTGPSDFGMDIFPEMLKRKLPMRAYLLKGKVIGIDTPESYSRLESYLERS